MRFSEEVRRLRRQILAAAAAHGAEQVRVFGSVARDEDSPESDIDFIVTLLPGRSLLDLTRLEVQLEEILGRRVDVVTETSLHQAVRRSALRHTVYV